jgi:hypothetical protein
MDEFNLKDNSIVLEARKLSKLEKYLIGVIAAITLLVFGTLWFIETRPAPPPILEYDHLPFTLVHPGQIFHQGDVIDLNVSRCNHSSKPIVYVVTRSVQNTVTGLEYIEEGTPVPLMPGCHRDVSSINKVPMGAPPGTYVVHGLGSYGSVQVEWFSQEFKVE